MTRLLRNRLLRGGRVRQLREQVVEPGGPTVADRIRSVPGDVDLVVLVPPEHERQLALLLHEEAHVTGSTSRSTGRSSSHGDVECPGAAAKFVQPRCTGLGPNDQHPGN